MLRKGREGASEVLGTMLVVGITVVFAAVLYFMLSSPAAPPPPTSTLILNQGPVSTNSTNASRNDTYLEVRQIVGSGQVFWNDSSFQTVITSANGTLLLSHNLTVDDLNHDGKANGFDRIYVRGMTAAYHGASLRVYFQGRQVADATLP